LLQRLSDRGRGLEADSRIPIGEQPDDGVQVDCRLQPAEGADGGETDPGIGIAECSGGCGEAGPSASVFLSCDRGESRSRGC
jgi:hypothetical protein